MDIEVKKQEKEVGYGIYTVTTYQITLNDEMTSKKEEEVEISTIEDLKNLLKDVSTFNKETEQEKELALQNGLKVNYYLQKMITKS